CPRPGAPRRRAGRVRRRGQGGAPRRGPAVADTDPPDRPQVAGVPGPGAGRPRRDPIAGPGARRRPGRTDPAGVVRLALPGAAPRRAGDLPVAEPRGADTRARRGPCGPDSGLRPAARPQLTHRVPWTPADEALAELASS